MEPDAQPTEPEPLGFSGPLRADLAADTPPRAGAPAGTEQSSEPERGEETGR